MARINLGELRHPIKIMVKEIIQDDYGRDKEVLSVKCSRRAKVKNTSFMKLQSAGITNLQSVDFTFRYAELNGTEIIEYDKKQYEVLSYIDLYNDKTFIVVTAQKVI